MELVATTYSTYSRYGRWQYIAPRKLRAEMAVGRWLFAAGVAVSAGLSSAQHDETETEVEAVSEGGGHVATHAGADSCIPVLCTHAGSHDFHSGTDLQTQMEAACHNVSMFNFMKNETEQIEVTCQACTPNSCAMGDHNCVPVFCTDQVCACVCLFCGLAVWRFCRHHSVGRRI